MKKGQAQFIGWVLLIGFTVVLATLVGNWVVQQARETTESMIDMTTRDLRCSDVNFAINCLENDFEVINTGYFTIKQIACYEGEDYYPIVVDIKPKAKSLISRECSSIVPVIEVKGKLIGCSEKQIEVKCYEEGY